MKLCLIVIEIIEELNFASHKYQINEFTLPLKVKTYAVKIIIF